MTIAEITEKFDTIDGFKNGWKAEKEKFITWLEHFLEVNPDCEIETLIVHLFLHGPSIYVQCTPEYWDDIDVAICELESTCYHTCEKCGSTDNARFRLSTSAVLCNSCNLRYNIRS